MALVDAHDRVLLLWRHRFVLDRSGWELPGGLVDEDEEPREAAARELEDQAGYQASQLTKLVSFQYAPEEVEGEHTLFVCRDAEPVADPIGTEGIARTEWVPIRSVPELIANGQIWVSATLIGLLHLVAASK